MELEFEIVSTQKSSRVKASIIYPNQVVHYTRCIMPERGMNKGLFIQNAAANAAWRRYLNKTN